MVAYGVPMADLIKLADSVGARLNEADVRGKGIKFTLRPKSEEFRKVNPISGRRVNAVCWHGHYEFFRALFDAYPAARIKADMISYNGRAEFEEKAEDTQYQRLGFPGNTYHSYTLADCCHCGN